MNARYVAILACLALGACAWAATLPEDAIELRNRGFAELENEQPAPAEEIFAELAELVPDDPMPHANLAIARLRQQKFEPAQAAIDKALELAPDRSQLVAIQAEVAQWSGRPDEALELMRQAATRGCSTPSTARRGSWARRRTWRHPSSGWPGCGPRTWW